MWDAKYAYESTHNMRRPDLPVIAKVGDPRGELDVYIAQLHEKMLSNMSSWPLERLKKLYLLA